jgi:hypothetical protein
MSSSMSRFNYLKMLQTVIVVTKNLHCALRDDILYDFLNNFDQSSSAFSLLDP